MKSLILSLWFAAPFGALFFWLNLMQSFASWSGGAFDRGGQNWIWLKCGYYGLVGLLFGLALMLALTKYSKWWLLIFVGFAMVILDFVPRDELWNCSYVDQAIDYVGYAISRMFPYVPHDVEIPPGHSPVIPPLTHVTVETPKGRLGIKSGHGLLRTYEWDGVTRSLELLPPESGRYGDHSFHSRRSLNSGERVPSYDWVEHNGITRGEAWESQMNFKSLQQADAWLEGRRDKTLPCVWTHDGLVIGWSTECDWKSLTIEVYQLLINGQKPSALMGSDDGKFNWIKCE
jgi:hypothetical protein